MIDIRMKTFVPALALTLLAGPALADAIDGAWCKDGRRFSIRGPEIVTPGGKKMEGNYGRHSFTYTAPAPEPGAGQAIMMTLVNENTLHLVMGEATAASETWVRCSPSVSSIGSLPRT